MACAAALMQENIWVDRFRVQDAEIAYHQALANQRAGLVVTSATNHAGGGENAGSDLINEIVRARQNIKNTLSNDGVGLRVGMGVDNPEVQARLNAVEQENQELKKVTAALQETVAQLSARVIALEKATGTTPPAPTQAKKAAPPADDDDDDDDDSDFDLFGEETEEDREALAAMKKANEEAAKKKKKKVIIAKSSILLDVKPWDDETDMKEIENKVRSIEADGLLWGAAKLIPLAYGIKKLQILCTVVDDKIGTDFLEEKITAFEDLVQSVDIAAFNKI